MDVDAYLRRIGADRAEPLAVLVSRHLASVPFETLSIHLGEPITTTPAALYDKIVVRRRGGFCHELNGAFAWLLAQLGYGVTLLGARVAGDDGTFSAPLAHLALRVVEADGAGPWLVDVGFGRTGLGPVPFDDPATFRPAPEGDLDVFDATGEALYRLEPHTRSREDFLPTCYWQATAPDSFFTRAPTCSLPVAGGRVTLQDRVLITTAADGSRTEDELTEGEALTVYRDRFGIALDRLPVPLHPPR